MTYDLRKGTDIAVVRVREGRLEALDARGVARIAASRTVLIDAKGTRRDARVAFEPSVDGGVVRVTVDDVGLEFPVVIDPSWSAVAPMANYRKGAASVVLPGGAVLVTGGGSIQSEVYDPTGNTWSTVAGTAFKDGAVTLTSAGQVLAASCQLVTAGSSNAYLLKLKKLDPTTSTGWIDLPMGPTCSNVLGTVSLSSGKVLVVGQLTYLIDPETGAATWAGDLPTLTTGYGWHGAPRLVSTGRVVMAGSSRVYAWTPGTDGWAIVPGPAVDYVNAPESVVLPSGDVLFAGDFWGLHTMLYATASNTSSRGPDMVRQHSGHSVSLLPTGRLLVAGTLGLPVAEELNVAGGSSRWVSSMLNLHDYHTAALLSSGKVLIMGGDPGGKLVEVYQTALGSSCSIDSDCSDPLFFCDAGTCASQRAYGEPCTRFGECLSNACVDGVCCNSTCTKNCEACDVPGNVGLCTTVPAGAPHGTRPTCAGSGQCGAICDGSDPVACHFPTTSKTCGANSCVGGVERRWSFCDGAGACNDAPRSCAPYACGPTSCRIDCGTGADCASGFRCSAGSCTP